MRLLHTSRFEFKEFFDDEIPRYAVLSHRWGDEEVSYQDFLDQRQDFLQRRCRGYGWTKIAKSCEKAGSRDIDWVWVDTCCIDKKSSAELTEAINSMFAWYLRAILCFVFLPDVQGGAHCFSARNGACMSQHGAIDSYHSFCHKDFLSSTWFTRAWTLQELLAPSAVFFYNAQFRCIGTKLELAQLISETTRIPPAFLLSTDEIRMASVSRRMKWASRRTASREEDVAYSLLGIFDVNMPLLYGEGGVKAFQRLQKEIIAVSNDESIFCWGDPLVPGSNTQSMIASTISHFDSVHDFHVANFVYKPHYELTHSGIRFNLPIRLRQNSETDSRDMLKAIIMPLNCRAYNNKVSFATTAEQGAQVALLIWPSPQWNDADGMPLELHDMHRVADFLISRDEWVPGRTSGRVWYSSRTGRPVNTRYEVGWEYGSEIRRQAYIR